MIHMESAGEEEGIDENNYTNCTALPCHSIFVQ